MFTMGEFAACLFAALFVVTLIFGAYVMCLMLKRGGRFLKSGSRALANGAIQLKGRWVADKISSLE